MKKHRISRLRSLALVTSSLSLIFSFGIAQADQFTSWTINYPDTDTLTLLSPPSSTFLTRGITTFTLIPHISDKWNTFAFSTDIRCNPQITSQNGNVPYDEGGIAFYIDGAPDNWAYSNSSTSEASIYWTSAHNPKNHSPENGPMSLVNNISINGVPSQIGGRPQNANSGMSGTPFFEASAAFLTFSTSGWPGGTYVVHGYTSDGCLGNYSSNSFTFALSPIPSPLISCTMPSIGTAGKSISVACNSSLQLNGVPYTLSSNTGSGWHAVLNGVASGTRFVFPSVQLPTGVSNAAFRLDLLGNEDVISPSTSNTMDVSISPPPLKPIKFICSIPQVGIRGVPLSGSCSASSDISQASIYFQQEIGSKWSNFGSNTTASGTDVSFAVTFNSTGKHHIRLGALSVPAVNLAFVSSAMTVVVNAPPARGSSSSSAGGSTLGVTKGKVDKTSRAYKTMFAIGHNFAKVSTNSDTAALQCGYALSHGIIDALGHPQYLGAQAPMIQSYLQTSSGYAGCIDGFNS